MFQIKKWKKGCALFLALELLCMPLTVRAEMNVTAKAAIVMEAKTGTVLYEKNADEQLSPASVTKIMTLLLALEQVEEGKASLGDKVIVSEHASSMGGSQVFLAQGEEQSLDTMLKCIAVASGNDASVAVAEHLAGSEEVFVDWMNAKAKELGMVHTNFVDCCGLTDSDSHYSTARDVAIMSRELINKYPKIYDYTQIWMEDITHVTRQGSSLFGLSSTNKLLKQYEWTTGLKTGSTSKAKYCMSATATKDDMDMIAVVMGADSSKLRFGEARALLTYGFQNCRMYKDEDRDSLPNCKVLGGKVTEIQPVYQDDFYYVDTKGRDMSQIKKELQIEPVLHAPLDQGAVVGKVVYMLEGECIGEIPVCLEENLEEASVGDVILKTMFLWLL